MLRPQCVVWLEPGFQKACGPSASPEGDLAMAKRARGVVLFRNSGFTMFRSWPFPPQARSYARLVWPFL